MPKEKRYVVEGSVSFKLDQSAALEAAIQAHDSTFSRYCRDSVLFRLRQEGFYPLKAEAAE